MTTRNHFYKMKNTILIVPALLIGFAFTSCDSPKNPIENQSVGNQSYDSTTLAGPDSLAGKTEGEDMTGAQMVDLAVGKLMTKLNLNDSQVQSIKEILTKTLKNSGEDLATKYPRVHARIVALDIQHKSSGEILAVLDPGQQEKFRKFLNH